MKTRIIKFAIAAGLLSVVYLPTLVWMVGRWHLPESEYGHGFFIPLVVLFFIFQKRSSIMNAKAETSFAGFWLLLAMLSVHMFAMVLRISFLSGFTMVIAIYALTLFTFGKEITRQVLFPILFLTLMIPLPLVVIGNAMVKLKLVAANSAVFILNHIGFPSLLDGSVIRMPGSHVEVAAPCSGIRSLIALSTLGIVFAYALKASRLKKFMLCVFSVPIALVTNVMRVVALAVVNDLYGEKVAMGFFHDLSGFLVFGLAFVILLAISKSMEASS